MSRKAIFAQTSEPYWVDVAAKLRDQYGWNICYFIGRKRQEKALKSFPYSELRDEKAFHKFASPYA